ncbi:MAG: hypothetical protein Q9183_005407 [Haloplaca sp. 2 TL-2023]
MSQSEAASSRPPDNANAYPQLLESPSTVDLGLHGDIQDQEAVETVGALDTAIAEDRRTLVVKLPVPAQAPSKETAPAYDAKTEIDKAHRRFDWGEERQLCWPDVVDKMDLHATEARHVDRTFKESFKKLEEKVLESEMPYTWTSHFDPEERKIILQLEKQDPNKQAPLTDPQGVYDDIAFYITHCRIQKILESIYIGLYLEEDEDAGKETSESGKSQESAASSTSSIASLNCRQCFNFDLTTKVQPFVGAQIEAERYRLMIQGLQHDRLLRQHLTSTEDDAIRAQEEKALERVEGHEEKTEQVKEVFQTLREKRDRQKKEPVESTLAACGISAGPVLPPEAHY